MSKNQENGVAFETDPVFEADLRAAMRSEPAGPALRQRILDRATDRNRGASGGFARLLGTLDPRNWRFPALKELGAAAAVASLAVGLFVGANGLLETTTVTQTASSSATVDLVALAYEDTGTAGDLQ